MNSLTPREIVAELDRYIVGQEEAKKAVAIALRNRWRRQQLPAELREEVLPKNILMMGPTGAGKTEIARRLARLTQAPFIKVEATKFTEIGYVGRDVEQIIRDLMEISIHMIREAGRKKVRSKAEIAAQERLLEILTGKQASPETRQKFNDMLTSGKLEERMIDIEITDNSPSQMPMVEIPGLPGSQMGMMNLGDILGKAFNKKSKTCHVTVKEARVLLIEEESDRLLEEEKLIQEAKHAVEQNGIVFIDEIDKVCGRPERTGSDVSREGVQRDLLPLIEGTTVTTKHGPVRTDHILFIASGAFHVAKPSALLPELQGRLPIRVELKALTQEDFIKVLIEPEASLIKQYQALLKVENITLEFTTEGIAEIAHISAAINHSVENIGARRLHTVLEKLLEDISFHADIRSGTILTIDAAYVQSTLGTLLKAQDLSRFIL